MYIDILVVASAVGRTELMPSPFTRTAVPTTG
jgi:hypothetical protein